jgi:hypothetical protein
MNKFHPLTEEFQIKNAKKHMHYLVDEAGERLSGTKALKKAADYVHNELQKLDLESWVDNFEIYHSYPGEAKLKITAPDAIEIETAPICFIESTDEDGIEGEMIYAKQGGYDDYEGIDVRGKIVLTDMTWSPGRPEKARIAAEKGVKALVIMNYGTTDHKQFIQMGGIKTQWGNPTPDTINDIPKITVLGITRKDGVFLKNLCEQSKSVSAWIKADVSKEWVTAHQPMAMIKSEQKTDEFILLGAHLDAWGKTAICNASGNALCLELARVLCQNKKALQRNILIAFWDGLEIAECAGSNWHLDRYWEDYKHNCIGYINVDNPGILGTTIPGVESVKEVKDYMLELVGTKWEEKPTWCEAFKGGGDASYHGIGIPFIYFSTEYTPEKLKELNYAFFSQWLHSDQDTVDKIDLDLFTRHFDFFLELCIKLSNEKIIPYNFKEVSSDINQSIQSLFQVKGFKYEKEVAKLVAIGETFENEIKDLESYRQKLLEKAGTETKIYQLFNKMLLNIGYEISPATRTVSGRYGQDLCCSALCKKPIPMVHQTLIAMSEREGHEYLLYYTEFLKKINEVFDGLDNAVQNIRQTKLILDHLIP